jgi:hypothetical protein
MARRKVESKVYEVLVQSRCDDPGCWVRVSYNDYLLDHEDGVRTRVDGVEDTKKEVGDAKL